MKGYSIRTLSLSRSQASLALQASLPATSLSTGGFVMGFPGCEPSLGNDSTSCQKPTKSLSPSKLISSSGCNSLMQHLAAPGVNDGADSPYTPSPSTISLPGKALIVRNNHT